MIVYHMIKLDKSIAEFNAYESKYITKSIELPSLDKTTLNKIRSVINENKEKFDRYYENEYIISVYYDYVRNYNEVVKLLDNLNISINSTSTKNLNKAWKLFEIEKIMCS